MLLSSEIIGGRPKRVWSELLPPTCEHTCNAAAQRLFAGLRWGFTLVCRLGKVAWHGWADEDGEGKAAACIETTRLLHCAAAPM